MPHLSLAGLCCSLLLAPQDPAEDPLAFLHQERDALSWWTDNLRWPLDYAGRYRFDSSPAGESQIAWVGLDLHNVLSTTRGDVGTMVLQAYLTKLNDAQRRPGFFESEDDWELVYRIFNFNYTQLFQRKLNLRIGHFEVPYGLEQHIPTNGTLRQYLHGPSFGVKADWGATINGELDGFEYEFAWSRGTGNEWTSRDDPGLFSGRIGNDRDAQTVWGASALTGRVLTPGGIVERDRFGLDVMSHVGPFDLMGEVTYGRDFDADLFNGLGEINWRDPEETTLVYLQVRAFVNDVGTDWQDRVSSNLGATWAPDNHWIFSAQWTQEILDVDGGTRDSLFELQLRYRL